MASKAKHPAGSPQFSAVDPDLVATRLRAIDIDNFSMAGNIVRIGSAAWLLSACSCGFSGCDGWSLEPIDE